MPAIGVSEEHSTRNPLDLLEEIIAANDWPFDRAARDELYVEIPGRWGDYRLQFCWEGKLAALMLTCALGLKVPDGRRGTVSELLVLTNERMWLGHFDLSSVDGLPMFRHALPLRGVGSASVEVLEDMVDIAITECERFFPALQFVVWGGKSPAEAVAAACLDPVGEA